MKLICGIHGSGKTTFCKTMSKKTGLKAYSASDLISRRIAINQHNTKRIDKIPDRQEVLIEEVKRLKTELGDFLLDGHLCLISQNDEVTRISPKVFMDLGISEIWCVIANPESISVRLNARSGINWPANFIEKFQSAETIYAKELADMIGIDLHIANTSDKRNLVLPIAPVYVEKILSGKKMYEYRKKINAQKAHIMYLYATYPIKRLVGEAEIADVIKLPPAELWHQTSSHSGITYEAYNKYFEGRNIAYAYELANVFKYAESIELNEIGIRYVPQSFVYVADM